MEGTELAKRDHQRNKSEIVKVVKAMFNEDKWGDEQYKIKLQELVVKDEDLVRDVIAKISSNKNIKPESSNSNWWVAVQKWQHAGTLFGGDALLIEIVKPVTAYLQSKPVEFVR